MQLTRASITSGPLQAFFDPINGGRLTRLVHDVCGEIVVPMAEEPFDSVDWPKAGAFPLFPYHGRLAQASLTHNGERFELLRNPYRQSDAMHGPSQRRSWRLEDRSDRELTMRLDYRADDEWPFDFHATQRFAISDQGLDIRLSLANVSARSFPAGIGWHPYFVASLDDTISCNAAKCWPPAKGETPIVELTPQAFDSTSLRNEIRTDHLSEWSNLTLVTKNCKLTVVGDATLQYLVVHRTATYVCLEPVSHLAGALSLPSPLRRAAGLKVLKPGEAISGRAAIVVSALC